MKMRSVVAVIAAASVAMPIGFAAPAAAAEVGVTIAHFEFDPDPVRADPGDTITWTNTDPGPHTVSADDGSFSAYLNEGESFSLVVDENGEIGYYCKLHGAPGEGMAGTILVGEQPRPEPEDLSAADNVASAIAWSASSFPDGSPFAVLGRADLFADSLASSGVQGKLDAPLLLTPSGSLDGRVAAELERLGVQRVTIMGGTAAISEGVADSLRSEGYGVDRVAGTDRIGTALAAAKAYHPEARSALLVRSAGSGTRAFADTLSAGALAASSGRPVLLTPSTDLAGSVRDYIASHGLEQVTLVGGEAALAPAVEDGVAATGADTERLAGPDRFGTAAQVAAATAPDGPTEHIAVIDGMDPDAWADGFPAASRRAPVVLADGPDLPPATAGMLIGGGPAVICGTSLSATACDRAKELQTIPFELPVIASLHDDLDMAVGLYTASGTTTICYDLFPPAPLTSASLQSTDGTELLQLAFGAGPSGDPFGCSFDVSPNLVANLLANPGDHRVVANGSTAPVRAVDLIAFSDMLGEAEVPSGDPEGFAFGIVLRGATPGELCVVMAVFAPPSSPITASHIHEGESGTTGPPVLTLDPPTEGASVACYDAGEALVNAIDADPAGYYINIHTEDHPGGALRGQLFNPFD